MSRLLDRADAIIYYLHVADELEEVAGLLHARSPGCTAFERRLKLLASEIRQDIRVPEWLDLDDGMQRARERT